MNTLFFIDNNIELQKDLINKQLEEPCTILITMHNYYKSGGHIIESKLYPQDRLIDDIGLVVMNNHLSMVIDIWDKRFNGYLGQDVDSLVLSIIGSFVNNITEPRKLIIDEFDEMSSVIQKRVIDVLKNSKRFGISTFITTNQKTNIEQLIMHADVLYIPQSTIHSNSTIKSVLDHDDIEEVAKLSKSETYLKRMDINSDLN